MKRVVRTCDPVRVGAIDYAVREVENLRSSKSNEEIWGEIHPEDAPCEIHLESNQPEQRKQITLWHEIIHAILQNAGKQDEVEDAEVSALAYGIAAALRDNPSLRSGSWG